MDVAPHVVFSSMGNDSIALISYLSRMRLPEVHVVYSNTGWAHTEWAARVDECENWVLQLGMRFHTTISEGMEALVKRKKGWPRNGMQFCTEELKINPAKLLLEKIDPEGKAVCCVGKRRAESKERADTPEFVYNSAAHWGRTVWNPLYLHTDEQRDELIEAAGFDPLPYKSRECFPCINSKRSQLRELAFDEDRIAKIERIEKEMGSSPKTGKAKTMFRPYRHMGATGIREVIDWANSERGKYGSEDVLDDGTGQDCDSGWCGA